MHTTTTGEHHTLNTMRKRRFEDVPGTHHRLKRLLPVSSHVAQVDRSVHSLRGVIDGVPVGYARHSVVVDLRRGPNVQASKLVAVLQVCDEVLADLTCRTRNQYPHVPISLRLCVLSTSECTGGQGVCQTCGPFTRGNSIERARC